MIHCREIAFAVDIRAQLLYKVACGMLEGYGNIHIVVEARAHKLSCPVQLNSYLQALHCRTEKSLKHYLFSYTTSARRDYRYVRRRLCRKENEELRAAVPSLQSRLHFKVSQGRG